MPNVTKTTKNFLQEHFPFIKVRKNEVRFVVDKGLEYEIPSDLFPLKNPKSAKVFTYADTEPLDSDSFLSSLYDGMTFKTGFCYTNTENLAELLNKAGVRNFKTYTGWVFAHGMPIHHCWLVYKDKYVFDPGITLIDLVAQEELAARKPETADEARPIYKELHEKYEKMPNSEIRTFGQVAPFAIYVGSETTPDQGRVVYTDMIEKYPEHPSYQTAGMNAHGASTLQKMLDDTPSKSE